MIFGSIGHHRLAKLLFDMPIHFLLDKQLSEFGDLKNFGPVGTSPNKWAGVTIVEDVERRQYSISSRCTGRVDTFMSPDVAPDEMTPDLDSHPMVTIAGLPIVDPESLSNELVKEILKDADSLSKLKRFKAFVHKNYIGEPLSFVENDLETRILDYRLIAKKWGVETLDSAFSISAADKVLSGACAGLVSSVFGMQLAQAAAIGLVAAVGATTLKVGFAKRSLAIKQTQHEVSYLAEIQDRAQL